MTIDVAEIPHATLAAGTQLFRIHRRIHGPWFFDGSGNGRFDPVHVDDRGSCYWALDPLGAWVEVFRTTMVLAEDDVRARQITTARLADDLEYADLSARRALLAGVTAAVSASESYDTAQQIASDLQGVVDSVLWRVRHDLSQALLGVVLFGPRGPASPDVIKTLPRCISADIPDDLVKEAELEFGYTVLPTPDPS